MTPAPSPAPDASAHPAPLATTANTPTAVVRPTSRDGMR